MENSIEKAIYTSCGMWMLWDYEEYKNIDSYDQWENIFLEDEDIIKQIDKEKVVPINIHCDGCFQFRVKINEELNDREKQYIVNKSDEYLLDTSGCIILSGLENIYNDVKESESIKIELEQGKYTIAVCLIEWDKEPGMVLEDGNPAPNALPDFIILVHNEKNNNKSYRKSIETFNE